ncbi:MAG: hypothetical protein A3G34_13140 [Candidatus Lindowbacteria bacterium RIFCSPLOWO2_12_FULL_62_27]|nr:MAG: hypothetical protein A3I06_14910 [Candidatus Lindowbacteria bacterium RIFCSPLOWO2_02_FULL_62_12]OGH62529.1 MAG: hypothetical protein A3G34_13140 [Candidatus Lindowbacteria bacterium RIFCSPLOWO2_12_FULL_62_27]
MASALTRNHADADNAEHGHGIVPIGHSGRGGGADMTPERIEEIKIHVRSFGLAAIIGSFADWITRESLRPVQFIGWLTGVALLMMAVALTKKKS